MSRTRGEAGTAVVELVLVVPVLLALLALVVFAGRVGSASADVTAAARDAARAASLRDAPAAARADAESTAEAALAATGVSCADTSVAVEAGALRPGGSVAVTVTCRLRVADLAVLRLPGHKTVSARSVAFVDVFRGEP